MAPDAVVEASLAGVRAGEVICIPPLEDRAFVERYATSRTALLQFARSTEIAERYSEK
jgi:hypothetical protein